MPRLAGRGRGGAGRVDREDSLCGEEGLRTKENNNGF